MLDCKKRMGKSNFIIERIISGGRGEDTLDEEEIGYWETS